MTLWPSSLRWLAIAVMTVPQAMSQPMAGELEAILKNTDVTTLALQAREEGDPERGARVFYTSAAACIKCHESGEVRSPLGPDLARIGEEVTDQHIIDSILRPSQKIRKGYETVTIETVDGQVVTGLVAEDNPDTITLRDTANLKQELVVKKSEIERLETSPTSLMPEGLCGSLQNKREFMDLACFVMEIAEGGPDRAESLRPRWQQLLGRDDLANLDHAGILRSLGPQDLQAGQRIYLGHCKNCHGTDGNRPNLATARAFGTQQLKFGADPYRMLLTLTGGNGLMAPMKHLSAKERYQVIHYIRQQLIGAGNLNYVPIDENYLQGLPTGTGTGEFAAASDRDYGPVLASQLEEEVNNGLTFRLPHQVTVNYDLHRMRLGGVWRGGFLNLSQTHHYRQRGEYMPEIDGTMIDGLSGWQWAFNNSFDIPETAKPSRGPVRGDWLQYYGHYLYADHAILSYGIHGRTILETLDATLRDDLLTVIHSLRIGAGRATLQLSAGKLGQPGSPAGLIPIGQTGLVGRDGAAAGHLAMIDDRESHIVAAIIGDTQGLTWTIDKENRMVVTIEPATQSRNVRIIRSHGVGEEHLKQFGDYVTNLDHNTRAPDLLEMTHGGPARWPEKLTVSGELGKSINGYALDTIPVPASNPWNAWMRTSALDFFQDGRAVITTYGGDVYIVSGVDDTLHNVTWNRAAAGLFEPFGVRVVDGQIYVTCRDGIKRLHDYDNNGEIDFAEAFWTDDDVSCTFHGFNFDLQTDTQGNFYLAKAGQHTDYDRPGTILKIPPTGGTAKVIAWGLRTPNGMGQLEDDRFTVSDNQGPWIPAGKISLITPGAFLGNMPSNEEQEDWMREKHDGKLPTKFDEPFIWTPQELDSSCGGQVWAGDQRWGPLSEHLIHSSYGKGWLFYLSLQELDGQTQASIVKLPHQWDAGVMRLRVNPYDGQVYGTGLSGWQGPPDGKDGCFQRLRYTGEPVRMINNVRVTPAGLQLTFSFQLDPRSAGKLQAWQGEMWNYLWSKRYGSDQFSVRNPGQEGHDELQIQKVTFKDNHTTAELEIPDLEVCDQVLLEMCFQDALGVEYAEQVYLTVHEIPEK